MAPYTIETHHIAGQIWPPGCLNDAACWLVLVCDGRLLYRLQHPETVQWWDKGRVSGTLPTLATLPLQGCRERNIFGLFRHTSLQNHLFLWDFAFLINAFLFVKSTLGFYEWNLSQDNATMSSLNDWNRNKHVTNVQCNVSVWWGKYSTRMGNKQTIFTDEQFEAYQVKMCSNNFSFISFRLLNFHIVISNTCNIQQYFFVCGLSSLDRPIYVY